MMPLAQKNNMACFQTWKKKENMHRNSNGFGVFARASVRNSIERNAHMYFLRKSSKGVVPFSNTFKLQMWQNTEKHNIFVYAFLETSEESPDFSKTNRVTESLFS